MSGFITIERGIWDHPLFKSEPMTEREAWMWMIAQAAWSATRHRVGNELVDVPRGSFMATLREMQTSFMWGSDKRVRTFLKTLEKEAMIGRTTVGAKNAPKTHVTIRNYEEYQTRGRTKDAPKTHDRTHHGRTTDAVKKQGNKITKEDTNVSSVQPDHSQHFNDFWEAFPHRNGKKTQKAKAQAAFKVAIKSGVPVSEIAKGVEAMHRDPDVKRGYGRGPVPWLNQQGWADEIPDTPPQFHTITGGQYGPRNRNQERDQTLADEILAAARAR